MSPINILYVAALENPASALFANQVLRLAREIVVRDAGITMDLVVLYPLSVLRHGPSRSALRHLGEPEANGSLRIRLAPLPFTSRSFYLHRWQIPMFLRAGLRQLDKSLRGTPHVIHCRSYPAARLALRARERGRTAAAIAFDTRGQYPEEGVITNRWTQGSPDHDAWRRFEAAAFEAVDLVANVSHPHTERVLADAPDARIVTIPTVVDAARFADVRHRTARRAELGWSEADRVFVFAGSFNEWRTPDALFAYYNDLRAFVDRPRLLILSNSRLDAADVARTHGVPDAEWALRSVAPEAVSSWLSVADVGLLVEPRSLISAITLGSKCGEYLAAGLPLLVSRHCGGAAAIVERHAVGLVVDTKPSGRLADTLDPGALRAFFDRDRAAVSRHCRAVARDVFDVGTVASVWIQHYRRLTRS